MKRKYEIPAIIILFIILILLILKAPIINRFGNNGELIISEIVASSKSGDAIEIYNGYDYPVNLEGYFLSDDSLNLRKFEFPSVVLNANSYLVISTNSEDDFKLPFNIDKSGEVITLASPDIKVLSRVYFENLIKDTSYGYKDNNYVYFYHPTLGLPNDGEYQNNPIKVGKSSVNLMITEYITDNKNNHKAKDKKYYSMIEIYNADDNDINLKGFYLSNSFSEEYKYIFEDVIIKAHSYITVYASGLNKTNDEVHTNFILDPNDKVLILSDNHKNIIDEVSIKKTNSNNSMGLYDGTWHEYASCSFDKENGDNYIKTSEIEKDVYISEVEAISLGAIELKNKLDHDIKLKGYEIMDNSGVKTSLENLTIKANGYLVIYASDNTGYLNGKFYTGFKINNNSENLYLYKNGVLIDEFNCGKMVEGISKGKDENNNYAYYKDLTFGKENSQKTYMGYSSVPSFSSEEIYQEKGSVIELSGDNVYYTLDGSFPTSKSIKYTKPITIKENTIIKAINVKDGYLESDVVSRTYLVDEKTDLAVISISSNDAYLFGSSGIITNYNSRSLRPVSFEIYENGEYGVGFVADMKLAGADSRKRDQKSMSIFLRKEYGLQTLSYPLFDDYALTSYSSILLRNAGEDPRKIRIQDAVLTRTLKGQMDIDMQEYRPVVVYINGTYYGMYNLRERMNEDYVVNKYGFDKGTTDFWKYATVKHGTEDSYMDLYYFIMRNDMSNNKNYEYVKSLVDIDELINYWIAESYYGNTDLGNIRFYKPNDGKWRWMLYDLDWSMRSYGLGFGYPVINENVPAATVLYSSVEITRKLYNNPEFKDKYLSSFAYHLKNTFVPQRMIKITDELTEEIANEMPRHIARWHDAASMDSWYESIEYFKEGFAIRYEFVINNLKSEFKLTNAEYEKYFGDIK